MDEVHSDAVRNAALDWWDVAMSTRVNDPKTSAKVVVMQRCHQRDLSRHLLERTVHGELLWPVRFGPKEIEEAKRSLGSYAAAGQLQQRPSPAEGGLLKRYWFRFWQPPGANLPPILVRFPDGTERSIVAYDVGTVEEMAQSWDCSFKDLDTSDYVVGQVWGRLGPSFFLGDQVRARMDCPATVHAVRQLSAKWPGTLAKLIEDKANGSAVIQMLAHEIPGLLPVNPGGGKVARAAAVSPLIEAGNIYLLHPLYAPWVNDFIEECAAFPNGAHDDQVDAMTQALLRWHMVVQQETVWYLPDYPRGIQISPI